MPAQRLSDARIAQLGREHKRLKDEIAKLQARVDRITDKVVTEYDRRGTRQLESHGVKVLMVAPDMSWYDYDETAEVLTPRQLNQVKPDRIDRDKLAELVATNPRVDTALLAGCLHSRRKKPYLSVTVG
jgi:hypothetical protein